MNQLKIKSTIISSTSILTYLEDPSVSSKNLLAIFLRLQQNVVDNMKKKLNPLRLHIQIRIQLMKQPHSQQQQLSPSPHSVFGNELNKKYTYFLTTRNMHTKKKYGYDKKKTINTTERPKLKKMENLTSQKRICHCKGINYSPN